ncbi:hypothetical protein ASG90_10590 [Nocardioides sp. Soil797]|nr:hypothetical protein ASG90_10590 [Nocardioides sp. Soil797]
MRSRVVALLTVLAAVLLGLAAPAHAADPAVNLTPPEVTGKAAVGVKLVADPGTWLPADATFTYQWLRDGKALPGRTKRAYRPKPDDVGHRVAVVVTATHPSYADESATSSAVKVAKGTIKVRKGPRVEGAKKYLARAKATRPRLNVKPQKRVYRWLRDGRRIPGATGRSHRFGWQDVGHEVRVEVTLTRPGYRTRRVKSPASRIAHRVPARHVVKYHVETRGRMTASVRKFRRLANASLNDPRGWRGASGIRFDEVRSGGSMTLVLAESSWLPRFSSGCSAQWSCRVGRFVVINQLRWKNASPAWNSRGGTLRGYRHMVINHETGHWLGWGHRSCPRAGAPAPVMQQQSISLQGCRFNPFPTAGERNVPRF